MCTLAALVLLPLRPLRTLRESPAATGAVQHGRVRADTLWSQALGTRKQLLLYLPPSYATNITKRYPVAYYLHGLGGSERDWVEHGKIDATMDSLIGRGVPEMILVFPDGDDGWYTTWNALGNFRDCMRSHGESGVSYCVPWPHYDDYVAFDVVRYVDSTYRTEATREHRALAGLSMGGYGAVSLALEYPKLWSAAASHSGVLSPLAVSIHGETFRTAANMNEVRAITRPELWPSMMLAFGRDLWGWRPRDPARRARRLTSGAGAVPALFIDVGVDDPYVAQSRAFHSALTSMHVPHAYAEWPGAHDWMYWRTHAAESLAWIAQRIAP